MAGHHERQFASRGPMGNIENYKVSNFNKTEIYNVDYENEFFRETHFNLDYLHKNFLDGWRPSSLRMTWASSSTWIGTMAEDLRSWIGTMMVMVEDRNLHQVADSEKEEPETLAVRAVSTDDPQLIVLDSGADVSLLPKQLRDRGRPGGKVRAVLEDAQGSRLENYGRRIAQVHFYDQSEVMAVLEDDFMVASVRSPLLSLGRLMQKGWSIVEDSSSETGIGLCAPDKQVIIPIFYKKNSLAIYACIRQVMAQEDPDVRMICTVVEVTGSVFAEVETSRRGWMRSTRDFGKPFCITTNNDKFINPTYKYDQMYWPRRTTLVQVDKAENRWEVIEFCEKYLEKENPFGVIDGVTSSDVVLTIMHNREESMECLGKVLSSDGLERKEANEGEPEFEFKSEPHVPQEIQHNILPAEVEQPDRGGAAEEIAWHFEPREILNIDGNEIGQHSSLRTLRNAAEYLGVSKGGSRAALWQRLNDKAIMLEKEQAFEVANKLYLEEHVKVEHPPLPRCPSEEERVEHEMAHLPFRPWCEFCVACKSKSDSQKAVSEEPSGRRSHPSMQMDFCFGKSQPKDPLTTVLVVVDTWTKMVLAVPLESKGSAIKQTAGQIVRFSLAIGYHENVEFIGDSEPTMKALLEMVKAIRQGMGYGTLVTYGKPYSKGRTAQVERWIQTLRRQASTLLHYAEQRCLVKLEAKHPLVAWSYLHAAWLLNRYHQSSGQATAFEAAYGRKYNGKITSFGEFVQVYHRPLNCKQGPIWVPGIWVGKSSDGNEDMHIVITPGGVVKGKAIRRSSEPWRGTWLFLARHQPYKVTKTRALGFSAPTSTLPRLVEDQEAEDVLQHALEHGDSEDEQPQLQQLQDGDPGGQQQPEQPSASEPQPERPVQKRPPTASIEELEMEERLREIGDQAPVTPEMDSELVDDLAVEPTSPQRRRMDSPTGSPTALYPPSFAGNIQQVHVDEENWEDEMVNNLDENEMDYEALLEDMLKDDRKPPDLEPEEMEVIVQEAGEAEVKRLFSMNVIVQPTPEDLEIGSFLTTKEVYDWRWRDSKWTRRCRLVAREFRGGDRSDSSTFAPTSHGTGNRLMLCLHLCFRWLLAFIDVRNAFLLVPQREVVLVQVPTWYSGETNWGVTADGRKVWSLRRCLPGQRNAAARWYEYLSDILGEIGFSSLDILPSMFRHEDRQLALCGHVDDLVIAGKEADVEWCLGQLRERFEICETGVFPTLHQNPKEPVRFLKRRHFFTPQGIVVMAHEKYVKGLMNLYQLEERRGKPTPDGVTTGLDEGEELSGERKRLFRSALGTLLYISQDRVDIQHSVRSLAQAMARPTAAAERGVKHLVLYLKRTEHQGILLPYRQAYGRKLDEIHGEPSKDDNLNMVEIFSDADWAGDQTSSTRRRHSVSSVMVFVNNCMVQSYSRSQKSIALSSCESEFLALTGAVAEGMHVRKIWEFLTKQESSMVAFTDSSSCLALSQRLGVGRTKHLDVRQLWLQKEVKQGTLLVEKIGTQLNLADLNTKKLSRSRREFLMFLIGQMQETTDGFEKVGTQEFEGYLNKKIIGDSLKHARRVILKEMLNGGSWTGPGNSTTALVTLAMLSLPRASASTLEAGNEVSMAMLDVREWWLATGLWWLFVLMYTGAMVAAGYFIDRYKGLIRWKMHQLWNLVQRVYYYDIRGEMILRREVYVEREMARQFENMNFAAVMAENPLEPVIVDWDPYHGRARRIRILDSEEDAKSDESFYERDRRRAGYVKRVKGARRESESNNETSPMEVDREQEESEEEEEDFVYLPEAYGTEIGKPKYLGNQRWTVFFVRGEPTWPKRMIRGDGRHINSDTPATAPLRGENYSDMNRLMLYLSRKEEMRARKIKSSRIFDDRLFTQFLQYRLQEVHEGHPCFMWDYMAWWDVYDQRSWNFFIQLLKGDFDGDWDGAIEGWLLSDPDNQPADYDM